MAKHTAAAAITDHTSASTISEPTLEMFVVVGNRDYSSSEECGKVSKQARASEVVSG